MQCALTVTLTPEARKRSQDEMDRPRHAAAPGSPVRCEEPPHPVNSLQGSATGFQNTLSQYLPTPAIKWGIA